MTRSHLVTFSDESMSHSRELCHRSAIIKGGIGANHCHVYTPWDVRKLQDSHSSLFAQGKGFGYWCWKPYLIDWLTGVDGFVHGVNDGDVIVYSDAGVEFIDNVSHVIDRMDQDIFLFGNNWEHAHWCKRDVIEEIWPISCKEWDDYRKPLGLDWDADDEFDKLTWSRFGKQVQASVIFFRVSDYTRDIVQEWLDWGLFEGGRLIDDSPSRLPNHPEFREHRHDQAILTTLAAREGIKKHWWPAMYNDGAFTYEKLPEYAGDDYPTLFHHHRRRNSDYQ